MVYFVVPLDVIPDFILGWGLIDDIAVIGYVFGQVQVEIAAFRAWQVGDSPGVADRIDVDIAQEPGNKQT